MRTIKIADRDVDDLITAINMRLCQIETGTTTYRAVDAERINSTKVLTYYGRSVPARSREVVKIRALDHGQRELINRMEDLIERLRKNESQ